MDNYKFRVQTKRALMISSSSTSSKRLSISSISSLVNKRSLMILSSFRLYLSRIRGIFTKLGKAKIMRAYARLMIANNMNDDNKNKNKNKNKNNTYSVLFLEAEHVVIRKRAESRAIIDSIDASHKIRTHLRQARI